MFSGEIFGRAQLEITTQAFNQNQQFLNQQNGLEIAGQLMKLSQSLKTFPELLSGSRTYPDKKILSKKLYAAGERIALNHDPDHPLFYPTMAENPEEYGLSPAEMDLLKCWIVMNREAIRSYQRTISNEEKINISSKDLYGIPTRTGFYLQVKEAVALRNLKEKQDNNPQIHHRKNREEIIVPKFVNSSGTTLLLDVDHLKYFNDNFDHATGDIVISTVSKSVLQNHRTQYDVICRDNGADEIILICPDTTPEEANSIFQRIQQTIESKQQNDPLTSQLPKITLSAGAATYSQNDIARLIEATNPEEFKRNLGVFIHRADEAVYTSKHRGRNQLTLYEPS